MADDPVRVHLAGEPSRQRIPGAGAVRAGILADGISYHWIHGLAGPVQSGLEYVGLGQHRVSRHDCRLAALLAPMREEKP